MKIPVWVALEVDTASTMSDEIAHPSMRRLIRTKSYSPKETTVKAIFKIVSEPSSTCQAPRGQAVDCGGSPRVRTLRFSLGSGRDDNSSWKRHLVFPNKIVIPSVAEGSAVRPSGFPNSGVLTQTLLEGQR